MPDPTVENEESAHVKKNIRYVANEKLMAVVSEMGLKTEDKAGFTKVFLGNGYHLYVAKTKGVGRIDYQHVPAAGARELGPGERFCRIVAQHDFSSDLSEEQIVESFRLALVSGSRLPAWTKPARQKAPVDASSPAVQAAPEEDAEEKAATRKRLIADTAKRLGAKVSPNAGIE